MNSILFFVLCSVCDCFSDFHSFFYNLFLSFLFLLWHFFPSALFHHKADRLQDTKYFLVGWLVCERMGLLFVFVCKFEKKKREIWSEFPYFTVFAIVWSLIQYILATTREEKKGEKRLFALVQSSCKHHTHRCAHIPYSCIIIKCMYV